MRVLNVKNFFSRLPDAPGVYLFYNAKKELMYVGKATSLRSRVRGYFQKVSAGRLINHPQPLPSKEGERRPIEQMVHEIKDISWQETDSVLEAIILEANMIKKYLPKYNVVWKDDKSWNYIGITKDVYPRIETLRQHEYEKKFVIPTGAPQGEAEESGAGQSRSTRPDFSTSLRSARNDKMFLFFFGPYPGLNAGAAMKILRRIFLFSSCQVKRKDGRTNKLKDKRMEELKNMKPCFYHQIGQCLGVCTGEITPKEYRDKVIRPLVTFLGGRKKQLIKQLKIAMRRAARTQDFEEAGRLRNQISAMQRIQDVAMLNKSFVSSEADHSISPPARGGALAEAQAEAGWGGGSSQRIEGYDISNLGQTGVVGSMVVFTNGEPDKSLYRKFRIRGFDGQSDVDALDEVIRRRLKHSEWEYPKLFLIDGGLPQVNRVKRILDELQIRITVVGIAKGSERKRNDIVFAAHDTNTRIDANDPNHANRLEFVKWVYGNTRLLIAVRDEAHRFAIGYQRSLRKIQ